MDTNKEKAARRLSIIFVTFVVLITLGILGTILVAPYDSGITMGSSLSGNNQYGGALTVTNDYMFYVQENKIMRAQRAGDELISVYEGDVSYLNPFDGFLYFVENGKILRIGYYGGTPVQMGTAQNVTMMSVNGMWIYYLTQTGEIHKLRSDGKQHFQLTDGSIKFTAFEAANRIVVATDGTNIYRMRMDGTECALLCKGTNITRMLYTLNNLYYCDNGEILQVKSVEAHQDDGTTYQGVTANIFTYNTNSEKRGCIYYWNNGELRVRKLQTIEHKEEEDLLITDQITDLVDLYSVDGDLYYHTAAGDLYFAKINDAGCEIKPVFTLTK